MSQSADYSVYANLVTDRLVLRPPAISDVATIFFLRTDIILNQYIKRKPPVSHQEVEMFINDRLQDRTNGKAIYWVISTKEAPKKCIGSISLWQFSEDLKTAEVGYDLHPTYHGNSIMCEALKAVVQFGADVLHLDRVEAFTHKENKASIRLLEKNHFTLTNLVDPDVPTNAVYAIQSFGC